jgi:hypothetical protein
MSRPLGPVGKAADEYDAMLAAGEAGAEAEGRQCR